MKAVKIEDEDAAAVAGAKAESGVKTEEGVGPGTGVATGAAGGGGGRKRWCAFYAKGRCEKGDECGFSHDFERKNCR